MKITKELKGDFVVLHVSCEPAAPFTRSISVAALAEGTLVLKQEISEAKTEAKRKMDNYTAVQKMLEAD